MCTIALVLSSLACASHAHSVRSPLETSQAERALELNRRDQAGEINDSSLGIKSLARALRDPEVLSRVVAGPRHVEGRAELQHMMTDRRFQKDAKQVLKERRNNACDMADGVTSEYYTEKIGVPKETQLTMSVATLLLAANPAAMGIHDIAPPSTLPSSRSSPLHLLAGKAKKKQGSKKATTKISAKGFGVRIPTPAGGRLLSEPKYEALYEWLQTSPKTNMHKVAVADFDGLRGVMALKDIRAGEEIVAIPATFAVDLGSDARDPLPAAQRLLATRADEINKKRAVYWATLPTSDSPDLCTPDFFSAAQREMLQWPPLVAQSQQRIAQIHKTLAMGTTAKEEEKDSDEYNAKLRELKWAVWAVLSRVLTVQGPSDLLGGPPVGRKLLIPFIDMFNHKGGTEHYLTGRTDGMLKVVAGTSVQAGEQIFIQYGDAATSNEEFVAHYGFHDPSPPAAMADKFLVNVHPEAMSALGASSEAEDEALLNAKPAPSYQEQLAIRLRLGLKRAARSQGLLPAE